MYQLSKLTKEREVEKRNMKLIGCLTNQLHEKNKFIFQEPW